MKTIVTAASILAFSFGALPVYANPNFNLVDEYLAGAPIEEEKNEEQNQEDKNQEDMDKDQQDQQDHHQEEQEEQQGRGQRDLPVFALVGAPMDEEKEQGKEQGKEQDQQEQDQQDQQEQDQKDLIALVDSEAFTPDAQRRFGRFVCYSRNLRGRLFQASGPNRWNVQNRAIRQCQNRSGFFMARSCRAAGCRRF